MNFLVKNQELTLGRLRDVLIRLEDTIIFALIERAQFKLNSAIYKPGAFPFPEQDAANLSFMEYFLLETEKFHARTRRYTSPDEFPFNANLPAPVLPPLDFAQHLVPNSINVNSQVKPMYESDLLPTLCSEGDDGHYGSSATRDIECLQALSRRIHYGKFIAEAKFRKHPDEYTRLIRAGDRAGILALLTDSAVEEKLLLRLRKKAEMYSQAWPDDCPPPSPERPERNGDRSDVRARTDSSSSSGSSESGRRHRLDLDMVVRLYRDFVIPLTKEVEVDYLMIRV